MGKHKLRDAPAPAGAKLPVRRGLSRGMFAMQCGALYGDKEKTQRKEQTGITTFSFALTPWLVSAGNGHMPGAA
ncbi:MAG: hypothetical protein DBY04_04570 [Clostridiales bacterium]|nr:MAG: hypothetical protein DBY04_04570 [Clostridiales bacterium]